MDASWSGDLLIVDITNSVGAANKKTTILECSRQDAGYWLMQPVGSWLRFRCSLHRAGFLWMEACCLSWLTNKKPASWECSLWEACFSLIVKTELGYSRMQPVGKYNVSFRVRILKGIPSCHGSYLRNNGAWERWLNRFIDLLSHSFSH
jgi:hypothetical protein